MSGKAFNLSKGVFSFNGRKGNVLPKSGDYTAEMVGALSSNSTGDNIPVSQSDVTSISAALSNKATNLGNVSSPYETVLDAVLSCTTDSSFFVDNASSLHNATDAPWRQNETQYFVSVDGVKSRRIVFAVLYGSNVQPQIAIRPVFGNEWLLDWTYIPITTPPQQFDLPLAEGWTSQIRGSCRYAITQENVVVVTFKAVHSAATPASTDTMIATLPDGFRPTALVHSVCIRSDFVSSSIAVFCTETGGVWIHSSQEIPSGVGVAGEIIFVAAS